MKSLKLFFAEKSVDKTKLVQVSQIRYRRVQKKNYQQENPEKVIHIRSVIKRALLSYTLIYPHYPPTKKRNLTVFQNQIKNECFVNSDRKVGKYRKNQKRYDELNCRKTNLCIKQIMGIVA